MMKNTIDTKTFPITITMYVFDPYEKGYTNLTNAEKKFENQNIIDNAISFS